MKKYYIEVIGGMEAYGGVGYAQGIAEGMGLELLKSKLSTNAK